MTRHIAQKIAMAFVTIFVIITISFFLVHIMPGESGDPSGGPGGILLSAG
mgnify:CR=1 FL=1